MPGKRRHELGKTMTKGRLSNMLILAVCGGLTVFISYIQYLTGPELSLTLFYLFPIILAAWKTGIWGGIIISFTGSALWFLTDLAVINIFSDRIIPYFNATFRLIGFLVLTYIVSELKNAIERQKNLARTDPLTSLLNKRAFYELSEIELMKAERQNITFSILCIDLDNFKQVNDELGHSTGDMLLKTTAKILSKNVRKIDLAGRLGGDEFCILFSGAGAESAFAAANKLKSLLLSAMQEKKWPVTFSMGLATFQSPPDSVLEMIQKGDVLMYTAKRNGKNLIRHMIHQ